MSWFLSLLAAGWMLAAAVVFLASKSAAYEILAAVLLVASMVCLVGIGICDALRDIEKRLPKSPKE